MQSVEDIIASMDFEMGWASSVHGELTTENFKELVRAVHSNPYRPEAERVCIRDLAARLNLDAVIVRKVVAYLEGEFDPQCLRTPPLTDQAKLLFNRLLHCNDEDVRKKKLENHSLHKFALICDCFFPHQILQRTFTNLYLYGSTEGGHRMKIRGDYKVARAMTLNSLHLGTALISCLKKIKQAPRWQLPFPNQEQTTRLYLVKKILHEPLKSHFVCFNTSDRKILLDLVQQSLNYEHGEISSWEEEKMFNWLLNELITETYNMNPYAVIKCTAAFGFTMLNSVADHVWEHDQNKYPRRYKLRYRAV